MGSIKLNQVWEEQLQRQPAAITWVDHGQRWRVTRFCIFCESTTDKDTKVTALPDKQDIPALVKKKELIYPENFVRAEYKGLVYEHYSKFLICGNYVNSLKEDKHIAFDKSFPIRTGQLRGTTANLIWRDLKEDEVYLAFTHEGIPMLKMCDGNNYLYITCAFSSDQEDIVITKDGKQYKPYGWNGARKTYTTMEDVMPKFELPDLPKLSNEELSKTLGKSLEELGIDPNKSEEDKRNETVEKAKEASKKETKDAGEVAKTESNAAEGSKVPETSTASSTESQTMPAEGESNAPSTTTTKRKRGPNKVKPVDLTEVIAQLGQPVAEDIKADEVLAELRQLRDLILAAARREANIATTYISDSAKALAVLQQIKAVVK